MFVSGFKSLSIFSCQDDDEAADEDASLGVSSSGPPKMSASSVGAVAEERSGMVPTPRRDAGLAVCVWR